MLKPLSNQKTQIKNTRFHAPLNRFAECETSDNMEGQQGSEGPEALPPVGGSPHWQHQCGKQFALPNKLKDVHTVDTHMASTSPLSNLCSCQLGTTLFFLTTLFHTGPSSNTSYLLSLLHFLHHTHAFQQKLLTLFILLSVSLYQNVST